MGKLTISMAIFNSYVTIHGESTVFGPGQKIGHANHPTGETKQTKYFSVYHQLSQWNKYVGGKWRQQLAIYSWIMAYVDGKTAIHRS